MNYRKYLKDIDEIHLANFTAMTTVTTSFDVQRIGKSRIKEVDFSNLEFGNYISDYMLVADFINGKWQEPKIMPYGDMPMSPAMLSLHYGQAVFEGMKA